MANPCWNSGRPARRGLSHSALMASASSIRRMSSWLEHKASEEVAGSNRRLVYKACADLMKATITAKKLAAATGSWWALRVEASPAWLGNHIAEVLHLVGAEQSQDGTASGPQSEEDEGDPQILMGLLHSTWQTDTEHPIGPSITTEGPTQYIDFSPWMGRSVLGFITPPTLATLIIQFATEGASSDTSHKTLGAFISPP